MDKSWIHHHTRGSRKYFDGIQNFIKVASRHADALGRSRCPCRRCKNTIYLQIKEVEKHLLSNGMDKGYTNWRYHGELKERQSDGDEEAESHVGPTIRLCKDTHFKEQIGRANEKTKRNYDEMIDKSSQVSQNSDGASPIKNDVEIVQNQLGIEHGFVVTNRQRASSSRKRVKVAEERNLQLAEEGTKLLEKLDKIEKMLQQQLQQPPPWFYQYQRSLSDSQQQQAPPSWYQPPPPTLWQYQQLPPTWWQYQHHPRAPSQSPPK